jgi:iron complex outermembrane receptor protein
MRKLLIIFSIGLMAEVAYSQTVIQGLVKDITNNEPLIGAFVTLKGTSIAAVTEVTGRYQIIIPTVRETKSFILIVNHLGFKSQYEVVELLPVDEGEVVIQNFEMEPDPLTLKGVTVTANRVEEELQNVPIAATVIESSNLTKRTVASTEEAFNIVPNLVTDAFLPSRATFSLRGLASDFTNAGIENSVGLYIDDVYYSRSYNFNSTLFDIERVEVLRGPQGTLFGKNTIGGVLHVISESPKVGGTFGSLEINAGTFRYLQLRGKYNTELVKDKVALRLSGSYRQRDGWLRQENPEVAKKNGIQFFGGRAALLLKPTSKIDIELVGFLSRDAKADFSEDYKTPLEGVDLLDVGPAERDDEDRKSYENEADRSFDRDIYGAIARMELKLDKIHKLTSISAFNGYQSFHARDMDASSANAVYADNNSKLSNISQEIRIATPRENRKLFYVAGLYFLHENLQNRDSIAFKEDMVRIWKIIRQNPSLELPNYFEAASLNAEITSSSFAAYLSSSYEFTSRIRINAGLRFSHELKQITFVQTPYTYGRNSILQDLVATPVGKPGDPFRRNATDDVLSGNVGMDFKTADNILLYFSLSRGFKGAGFNLGFTPDVNVEKVAFQFKPEFLNSFEVGLKMKSGNRYLWNAAVFVTDFRNKQEVVTAGSSVFVANAKSIQGQGFEGEFTGIWTRFLRTDVSLGLLNLRYLNFPFFDPLTLEQTQLSGNRALKAPNFTFKFSPEFHAQLGKELKVLLRMDYDYVGEVYNDIFNTKSLARKPAGLLNARLSISTNNERFSVSLWGKNLTNEVFIQHGWRYTWGEVVSVIPPRMAGVELRTNFY